MEKNYYEAPEMQVFQVRLAGRILDTSTQIANTALILNMTIDDSTDWGSWE